MAQISSDHKIQFNISLWLKSRALEPLHVHWTLSTLTPRVSLMSLSAPQHFASEKLFPKLNCPIRNLSLCSLTSAFHDELSLFWPVSVMLKLLLSYTVADFCYGNTALDHPLL